MSNRNRISIVAGILLILAVLLFGASGEVYLANAQAEETNSPEQVVKLIFIHHSTGENWLQDGYGNLGLALGANNYYVSDTNYGWGPDSIGDRTDIYNWPEWFRGESSQRYLEALYLESGQNSWYSRTLSDPGGENQIVMFKSCFPNSDLAGNPDDAPAPGLDLTVSNVKYIYNDLLNYFVTRPDKLFILITSPPLQYPDEPENARAVATWLARDWLHENDYPLDNVAVFDFYNVLTHPDNHHRVRDGVIEYINEHGDNTLYYDSDGDDHPNETGSQKATDEFVLLLNVFYHRWKASAGPSTAQPPESAPTQQPAPTQAAPTAISIEAPAGENNLIDDFEGEAPIGAWGWRAYWDEATSTKITCGASSDQAYQGQGALQIDVAVAAESWATCTLDVTTVQDWRPWQGVSFYVRADRPGLIFDFSAYGGSLDEKSSYLHAVETTQAMVDGWVYMEIGWDQLLRAEWEAQAGAPYDPSQVTGISFGFDGYRENSRAGEIWVDNIQLISAESPPVEPAPPQESKPESTEEVEEQGGLDICPNSIWIGGLWAVGLLWLRKLHKR